MARFNASLWALITGHSCRFKLPILSGLCLFCVRCSLYILSLPWLRMVKMVLIYAICLYFRIFVFLLNHLHHCHY